MRACFGRRYLLCASHRLHADTLSVEQNQATYGKCNHPHGHGHNYTVEVLVTGEVNPDTGMVVNMVALDEAVQSRILDRFDHANLNLDPLFVNLVPTTENLSKVLYELVDDLLEPAKLLHVRVEETENNFFEYCGNSAKVTQ